MDSERNNYQSTSEREAILVFNKVKETYAFKIEELNELKRQVFLYSGDQVLDHHQRSRLRIVIESLLIDVNEEIFSLSEELARSFASFEAGGRGSSKEGVL